MNDSKTPIIGLTSYYQQAKTGVWDCKAAILPQDYVHQVSQAGAYPLLLPPLDKSQEAISRLDGLILTGGPDINPSRYGQSPHPETDYDEERDRQEINLLQQALKAAKPILAICRGMQLLNVALGGSLHQHLPELLGHNRYRPGPGQFGSVEITTQPGSTIQAILGQTSQAPCYHHQGINRIAPGLRAVAHSPEGLCQALEFTPDSGQRSWMLAVQWHPEHNWQDRRIIDAFVAQTRQSAQEQEG